MNICKLIGSIFIGIIVLSEIQFSPGIVVKLVCINGYEFVVSYSTKYSMGKPIPTESPVSVIQVYQMSRGTNGAQPMECK